MKKQLTFYFIRHGKTVWNTEGLMQGHGDSPLTEEGINGAKKTGVALNHIPFIAAYSSVLKRTIATASHIIGERDIPLFHHQGLNEQYFGSWEGQLVDTLREHPEFQQHSRVSAPDLSGSQDYNAFQTYRRKNCCKHFPNTLRSLPDTNPGQNTSCDRASQKHRQCNLPPFAVRYRPTHSK